MRRSMRRVGGVAIAVFIAGSAAWAQQTRGRPRGGGGTAAAAVVMVAPSVITIPVAEATNMLNRQRVYLVRPPAGSTAFGLAGMGDGRKMWAVLPSCRPANPDDPRDQCPVARLTVEVVGGSGEVRSGEPQTVTAAADARRVQTFVVPTTVTQIRLRLRRQDDAVRWEGNIEVGQLGELSEATGTPGGPRGFNLDFTAYPGR